MERTDSNSHQTDRAQIVATGIRKILLPDIATPAIISDFLGVPTDVVISMLESGELPGKKIRGSWYVTKAALLEALKPDPTPAPRGPRMLPGLEVRP